MLASETQPKHTYSKGAPLRGNLNPSCSYHGGETAEFAVWCCRPTDSSAKGIKYTTKDAVLRKVNANALSYPWVLPVSGDRTDPVLQDVAGQIVRYRPQDVYKQHQNRAGEVSPRAGGARHREVRVVCRVSAKPPALQC